MTRGSGTWITWLRWMLPLALLAAWRTPPDPIAVPVAGGSGQHAWWAMREGGTWVVQHAPRTSGNEAPMRREVGRFDDEPVAIACEDARAWLIFRGAAGRSEVLLFEAARNPASGLWFSVPSAGRLCASVPVERIESAAAVAGELWVSAPRSDVAWRLQGERWIEAPMPGGSGAAASRALVSRAGELWCVACGVDGGGMRWRAVSGGWRAEPLDARAWTAVIPGSDRLTFVIDGRVACVQAGRADPGAKAPAEAALVGWGDGCLALRVASGEVQASRSDSAADDFGPFVVLPVQKSGASRWFHLPLLGVLSLGALMLAGIVRMARPMQPESAVVPFPIGRRLVALAIDVAPLGAAGLLAFDADLPSLLRAPLLSTDLRESLPFVTMAVGAGVFGFAEEAAGGRSLGKRLMGGVVLRRDGERASRWRHLVRNLLKTLVLLAPVLALPTLLGRRGEGIPETVSGTTVGVG